MNGQRKRGSPRRPSPTVHPGPPIGASGYAARTRARRHGSGRKPPPGIMKGSCGSRTRATRRTRPGPRATSSSPETPPHGGQTHRTETRPHRRKPEKRKSRASNGARSSYTSTEASAGHPPAVDDNPALGYRPGRNRFTPRALADARPSIPARIFALPLFVLGSEP